MNEEPNNQTADEIDRYVNAWVGVLTMMRGRSPEEARRWAEPFVRSDLELTLHEPAAYWVAPALVPAEFAATLDPQNLGRLHGDLQFALDQGDSFWDPRSDEELRRAHQRVLAVLNNYRAQIPPGAASDVFQTELPRSEALELGVRVVARQWRRSTVIDPIRGIEFGRHPNVPFGKASRLLVHGPDGDAHLWWDAFGLILVVVAPQREKAIALLEAARSAFDLNNYRGAPTTARKAAA